MLRDSACITHDVMRGLKILDVETESALQMSKFKALEGGKWSILTHTYPQKHLRKNRGGHLYSPR